MRIVAGIHGGRRLSAPPGAATRPTADRVREAVFSMLGPLDGETVLDLFAGSGALGIEALSRGAAHATFVDSADRAISVIEDNVESLGIGRPDPAEIRRRDARAFLRDARAQERHYSLVLLDPPYRHAASLAAVLSEALPPILDPGARIVSESDRRSPLELTLPLADERRYGDTLIRIHTT
jgi:16S rRNA (guanine(966)-N(2))-methyltransferase RsmD